jgi:hypothetical protein
MILPCSFCTKPCSFEEDGNECSCCVGCIDYQMEMMSDDDSDWDSYDDDDDGGDSD